MTRALLPAIVVATFACGSPRAVQTHFDDDDEAARREAMRSQLPLAVEVLATW